jgi:hypothetical protein
MILCPDSASATFFFITDLRASDRTPASAPPLSAAPSTSGGVKCVYEVKRSEVRRRATAG